MILAAAKLVRDEARRYGYHSIVPLGHGPDGYFARIYSAKIEIGADSSVTTALTTIDFRSRAEFRAHHAMRLRQRRALLASGRAVKRRSPIEMMVDRAYGIR